MIDRRKNNRGHVGKAGRKPKADEVALIERMDAISAPVEAWQKLWSMASAGDMTALRVWLEYRYGKPRQAVEAIIGLDLGRVFEECTDV